MALKAPIEVAVELADRSLLSRGRLLFRSASVGHIAWDVCLAVLLCGLLIGAAFYKLPEPKRAIGLALSYTVLGISPQLLLCLLEHLTKPAGPRRSPKRWLLHLQIVLARRASGIPFGILAAFIADAIVKYFHLHLGLIDLRITTKGVNVLLIGVFVFVIGGLVGDFFFYWYHRALHRSAILWQHHKMHHIDPEFDALTGGRQNWLEDFFIVFFIAVPVSILFRFDELDPFKLGLLNGAIIGTLNSIKYINHSNLRLQFGKASVLFTSSQSHRIHHSLLPQHHDKNFVAFFPIWDILFGTYYHPARDEFPLTGVEGEKEIESLWEAQIFTLREWWKMFRARRAKLSQG
jgi:sterol desaturase/sphingolipid hydroxylase (fatty acid hydroxylase superfamily)